MFLGSSSAKCNSSSRKSSTFFSNPSKTADPPSLLLSLFHSTSVGMTSVVQISANIYWICSKVAGCEELAKGTEPIRKGGFYLEWIIYKTMSPVLLINNVSKKWIYVPLHKHNILPLGCCAKPCAGLCTGFCCWPVEPACKIKVCNTFTHFRLYRHYICCSSDFWGGWIF